MPYKTLLFLPQRAGSCRTGEWYKRAGRRPFLDSHEWILQECDNQFLVQQHLGDVVVLGQLTLPCLGMLVPMSFTSSSTVVPVKGLHVAQEFLVATALSTWVVALTTCVSLESGPTPPFCRSSGPEGVRRGLAEGLSVVVAVLSGPAYAYLLCVASASEKSLVLV